MGLLDGNAGPVPSKVPRYVALGLAATLALGTVLYLALRYRAEKATATQFMTQVVAGDFQGAYHTWHGSKDYSFADFMGDWGPSGTYGPVKSFEIYSAKRRGNASGVVVTVIASPVAPFPSASDPQSRGNKPVDLWIESADQSMSYAPEQLTVPK